MWENLKTDMPEKTCPTHHLELKFIPEGIAKKTGNRFNAFYGCPERACKYSENIEEKKGHFLSIKAEMRRAKEIAYFNSVNAAIEMAKIFPEQLQKMNLKEIRKSIVDWRDWFRKEWEEFYLKEVVNEED